MKVRGNQSLAGLKRKIRELPVRVAQEVARTAAPSLTSMTHGAFETVRTVYGEARPLGVDGAPLTLEESGETKRTLHFTAVGTQVRCVLGPRWAKYLIGKYGVLPNGAMPAEWSRTLDAIVHSTKGSE